MAAATRQYEKLPGRTSYFIGVAKLWAHSEHLLGVTTYFGIEVYRRYFYRDIQALMIRQTKARFWWNLAFGGCGGLVGVAALAFYLVSRQVEQEASVVWMVFASICAAIAGIFLIALIWNSMRGATCELVAQMATGPQSLPGVTRLRSAKKILERITPRIMEAQASAQVPPMAL